MDDFSIRTQKGEPRGKVKVNITITDIDVRPDGFMPENVNYNAAWEKDLIFRIAHKLAKFDLKNMELIFSVFSSGDKSVFKGDFKDKLLRGLGMQKVISSNELDRFLEANSLLANKESIDLYDFKSLFELPIAQARSDA